MPLRLKNKFVGNDHCQILKIVTNILMEFSTSIYLALHILSSIFPPNYYRGWILTTVNLVNGNDLNQQYMPFLPISASLILLNHVHALCGSPGYIFENCSEVTNPKLTWNWFKVSIWAVSDKYSLITEFLLFLQNTKIATTFLQFLFLQNAKIATTFLQFL